MSEGSEMAAIGKALNEDRKERHAEWKKANTEFLELTGLPFRSVNSGESLLFRIPDMPKVDFYPSTGRWRVNDEPRTKSGGAKAFYAWFNSKGGAA